MENATTQTGVREDFALMVLRRVGRVTTIANAYLG